MDANEVLKQYSEGQRNFRSQDLKWLSFVDANLNSIDFSGTILNGADLSGADLGNANLNWTMLKNANLSGANLVGAKMPDGRPHNDILESANHLGI